MGNLMSAPNSSPEVKKYIISDTSLIENKDLIDKILYKSKKLYEKNMTLFLDENFCNNMFIAYSKKLYELPIKKK